jgi:cytochrome c peroxidase
MRGFVGDTDVFGKHNELADFDDKDLKGIWAAVMKRVMAIPEYRQRFADSFPGIAPEDMEFSLVAKAIAAFVTHDFAAVNDPWDNFLRGDDDAMTDSAKRGALVYMSDGRCVQCHGTNLLTDQELYDLAVPHVGPGPDFNDADPVDLGLERLTGNPEDRYAFRTPPLRNIALTGPYMHDGAFVSLEDAVRHHFDCAESARHYNYEQLNPELWPTVRCDEALIEDMEKNPPDELETPIVLTDAQFTDLMAFLNALTDPASKDMTRLRPSSVPSGMDMSDQ